jgi:hypothetical protein
MKIDKFCNISLEGLPPGPDQTAGKIPLNKITKVKSSEKGGGRSSPVYAARICREVLEVLPRPKTKDINK